LGSWGLRWEPCGPARLQCAWWAELDVAKSGHGHSGHEALVRVHRNDGVLVIALSSFSVLFRLTSEGPSILS